MCVGGGAGGGGGRCWKVTWHGRILFGVLLEEKIGHYSQLGDFHSHVKNVSGLSLCNILLISATCCMLEPS